MSASEMVERKGVFYAELTVGETGFERFTITLDDDPSQTLYPIVPDGDTDSPILGPDEHSKGKCFKVIGMPYVTYLVSLELANGKKEVSCVPKGKAAGNASVKPWTIPRMIERFGKEFPADVVWRRHPLPPTAHFTLPAVTYGVIELEECPLPQPVWEEMQKTLGSSLPRFRFGGNPLSITLMEGNISAQEGGRPSVSDVDYLILGLFASEEKPIDESKWAPDARDDMGTIAQQSLMLFKELARMISAKSSPKYAMVLCDAQPGTAELKTAGLLGLLRTVRLEIVSLRSNLQYMHTDAYGAAGNARAVVSQLVTELNFPDQNFEVRYEGLARYVQKTRPSDIPGTRSKAPADCFDGACVITGGLGGLGVVTAESLVEAGGRCMVLCSRSGKITRDNQGLGDKLDALGRAGADVVLAKCDTTQEQSIIELLDDVRKKHAP
eukprot:6188426-Amphidinium_carterae.1